MNLLDEFWDMLDGKAEDNPFETDNAERIYNKVSDEIGKYINDSTEEYNEILNLVCELGREYKHTAFKTGVTFAGKILTGKGWDE